MQKRPVEHLGLNTATVKILKSKGINDYDSLCDEEPDTLKEWGLDTDQIAEIINLTKDW